MLELKVSKPLHKYEAIIILHPETAEADQKTLFKKNQEIIKSFNGEINHLDTWGKRKLANPIKKNNLGIYFHTTFEAESTSIKELERTMRINDKVLRYMHSRLDDRVTLSKHMDAYRETLAATTKKEQERESKAAARRAAPKKR